MTTLAVMKQRVANEIMRADLTTHIASAITDAITFYQTQRFSFNTGGTVLIAAPASDAEASNAWMTTAEPLIRARAKYLLAINVMRDDPIAPALATASLKEAEDQFIRLQSRAIGPSGTVNTLGYMKARIADELGRSDLTPQIATAISDAIAAYQTERFWFNESRAVTFNTVANQEFYTSAENANIPNLLSIDYIALTVGTIVTMLRRAGPEELEDLSNTGTSTGEPWAYSYYNRQLRLYPIPSQVYAVRIAAHVKTAAPASDAEADNPWMVEADRLIRSRAKLELAAHNLWNASPEAISRLAQAVDEAHSQLKGRTNRQVGTGRFRAMRF